MHHPCLSADVYEETKMRGDGKEMKRKGSGSKQSPKDEKKVPRLKDYDATG
jgi:hypothetical protein